MSQADNLGSFFKETKTLLKLYFETKLKIAKLKGIRAFAKFMGLMIWITISLFLFFLVFLFGGIVLGFWFSEMFNSFTLGFGLAFLLLVFIFILLISFRKLLFIKPLTRIILREASSYSDKNDD